jgi:hypothetical protein
MAPSEPIPYTVRLLRRRVAGPGAPVFDLKLPGGAIHRVGATAAKPAFTLRITNDRGWRALFQIYLWAGAHLHRDGGLEAYRAVFQKARGRPSAGLGVRAPR